ncbi:protein_kinase_-_putative [Leishmania infantum]|uniref:mitogen-activated protein kinase kinase n=1 Tax=Leishmania infantum TaxID=5671 RepID=A0A6L0WIE2_LEIIN|nr:protein_kinase_-_putative [Leishmania infantum]SUZ39211.1 protein_kinase_-_putative [Leishmania infantum]
MSGSQLHSATAAATMTSTAVSSASAEPSPPTGSSSTAIMSSSLTALAQQQQRLLVSSLLPCDGPLQYVDPTADGLPGTSPSCSEEHNSCTRPDAAQQDRAVSMRVPHATAHERSEHASNDPGPSPPFLPAAEERLTGRSPDAADATSHLDHDGAADCATSSSSTATASTISMHITETCVLKDTLPAPPMQDQSSSEGGVDATAARYSSSPLVNAGSDATLTMTGMRSATPSSPLKAQSNSLQPKESAKVAIDAVSRGSAGQQPSASGGLTTMMTTATSTNTTTAARGLPRTMLPDTLSACTTMKGSETLSSQAGSLMLPLSDGTPPSCSMKAATAALSGPRREKRRPPSLFSSSPATTSLTVATRPVLITPAVSRQEDRSLTTSVTQTASSVSQTNQPLHGQVQRPPAPLPRTPGAPSPLSSTLVSSALPTHGDGGVEEDADGERLSTLVVRRDLHELAATRLPMNPASYAPVHVKLPAVLPTTSPPLRSGRPAHPIAAQQHRAACESQGGLTGSSGASTAAHHSAAGATTPAAIAPVSTPSSVTMFHYGSFQAGYASTAAAGGAVTPNATPLLSNSSLCGFANYCGAGSLGSGSAPAASLSTATSTACANRLQPPSAARLSVTGMGGGGGGAVAGVLSPLSLSGAAATARTVRRRAPPPLLFRLRSPVGPAPPSTAVSANDTSGEMTSPGSVAPPSSASRTATSAAAAAASAGACSSVLTTPPLNSRSMGMTMNSGSASDLASTMADRPARGSGCNPPATPARSGPFARAHGSVAQNLNTFSSSTRSGGLVRISHDRRTLVAGMFRVSRDGCLTVRNMLLLNPTRIDAGSATGGAAGPGCTCGSFMGSSTTGTGGGGSRSRPLQLLHPQRSATNYSPVSSNGGLVGRMQLLGPGGGNDLGGGGGAGGGAGGLGPMTPNTTGSDWYSPHAYHGGGGGSGNTRNMHHSGGGGGGANTTANASFTLFSTSMDTPFSPITYSMDSQRLALPSPLGVHHDRAGAAAGPPPQLLGTVCENTATSHFLGASGSPHQQPQPHDGLLPGSHHVTETNASPTRNLGFGMVTGGAAAAAQQQVATPNSTTALGRPSGGSGGNICHAQLRRQASNGWLPGALGATNTASPPPFAAAGGAGGMLNAGAFTDTDTANSLLLPYADIPTYRGGIASATAGSRVDSPSGHTNPGGFRTTTTAATATTAAAPMMGGSGATQNTSFPPLPPNVVRLRDLDILSTTCGEGASATVFVAIHKPTGRRLAVKRVDLSPLCLGCSSPFLRSGAVSSGRINQLQRIVVRELQVLHLTYRSPFMVKVYNAFFLAEVAALDIVMEFMHYGSLDHLADCLQQHARMVRGSQQERHRLLTGDDDQDDGDGGGHSGRCGSVHGGSPSVPPLLCDAPEAPQVTEGFLKDTSAAGVGRSGTGGDTERRPSITSTSPKLLDSQRTLAERAPPSAPRPCISRVVDTTGSSDVDSIACGSGGVPCHPLTGGYKHIYGSNDSLLLDSYSVKSDCGTDDSESDDGSGLVEEPLGVTERLVAVVGEQLLRGVRDMHSRGYIHQDIKPGNVLVNEHGVVKLSDFGLSQRCDSTGLGIKNDMLTYVPPPSVAPAQSITPLQSPSLTVLPLTGARGRRAPFVWHAQRGSIGAGISGQLGSGMVGTTPPEMGSSAEGLVFSSTTNSLLAQRDGMDVLEAESTSSEEGPGEWDATRRGRSGLNPSSSSSDDAGDCCGTDKYMSPERQRGEPYGKPADIWAVGVTLAEFAVGEYPYDLKDVIDEFDRVSRMDKPVDVLQFNKHRAVPLGTVFADFCRLATLPTASQRPTAQELLEHPFFKQWHRPFNLKDYLAARVPVPSNRLKEDYLAKQRERPPEGQQPAGPPG